MTAEKLVDWGRQYTFPTAPSEKKKLLIAGIREIEKNLIKDTMLRTIWRVTVPAKDKRGSVKGSEGPAEWQKSKQR